MSAAAVLCFVLPLFSALAWPLGWRIGVRYAAHATLAAGALTLLLAGGVWFSLHPAWFPEWMLATPTVLLIQCWFAPPAVALFAIAAGQARERDARARCERPQKDALGLEFKSALGAACSGIRVSRAEKRSDWEY